jgi:16S rRNA (guanine527-N7)-methyltransferase
MRACGRAGDVAGGAPHTVHGVDATPARPRLDALATQYGLPATFAAAMDHVLARLAVAPISLSSVTDPIAAADVHVADALVALDLPEMRAAEHLADLGAGAGFPGLALAAALPGLDVRLVESVAKKCAFMRDAAAGAGIANAEVVCLRAEAWSDGLDAHDVVTARAVAPLTTLVEYAAPLLREGGTLVAFKGRLEAAEEADGAAAAAVLRMSEPRRVDVTRREGPGHRSLYLSSKVGSTPNGYPRRPGIARKRPLQASSRA